MKLVDDVVYEIECKKVNKGGDADFGAYPFNLGRYQCLRDSRV